MNQQLLSLKDMDLVVKELFKTRDKETGGFKPIVWRDFQVSCDRIPIEDIVKLAAEVKSCRSCKVCYGQIVRTVAIESSKYNLSWCTIFSPETGKLELVTPTRYLEIRKKGGIKYAVEGEEKVFPTLIRTRVSCTCVDKHPNVGISIFHNKFRTEWYRISWELTQEAKDRIDKETPPPMEEVPEGEVKNDPGA